MSRIHPEQYAQALVRLSADVDRAALEQAVDVVADELVAAGRASWLPRIMASVERAETHRAGGIHAVVETSQPLTMADRKALGESLGVAADKLAVEERVDPTLTAGIRVQVGDSMVAGSVRDKVEKLFPK